MNFIPTINSLTKLFTLKHSCFSVNFTLKHSWKYAETLLRSIYTYIYLYKNTCSWKQQVVNNYFFIYFSGLIISSLFLTSCYKEACQPYRIIQPIGISQHLATHASPAPFYVCSQRSSCVKPTATWQAKNYSTNKQKGACHVQCQIKK